jgi:N6-L-threonylcarbamoyladenine synthase
MNILAIESSCDETAAAVIEDGTKIISSAVATSSAMHEKWGGIVPEVAAREQLKSIIPVIIEALKPFTSDAILSLESDSGCARRLAYQNDDQTKQQFPYKPIIEKNIDAIAVTVGPGLIGSLLIGVEVAKTIAFVTKKPIIPVNHVLAHMYANFVDSSSFIIHSNSSGNNQLPTHDQRSKMNDKPIIFPAISLVVSGGHTELFLMTSPKDLKWLGGTIDDAAGEAFDKTARLLGFGARGGLAIQEAANKCKIYNVKCKIKLPRPLIHEDNLNFSFSGLKTAILREVNKLKQDQKLDELMIQQLAYETQEAITDVLVAKTIKAAEKYNAKSILIGGGVAANLKLRGKLKLHDFQFQIHIPPVSLCTDNAIYIGAYAFFRGEPTNWQNIDAIPDLSVEI